MSNTPNEAIMERLYDEAWQQLYENPPIPPSHITDVCDYQEWLEEQAHELAKKRFEFDYA